MTLLDDPMRCPPVTDDPEPLLAGTLYLLSGCPQQADLGLRDKVLHNLQVLARHPGCSEAMRAVCRLALMRWLAGVHGYDHSGRATGALLSPMHRTLQ